MMRMMIAECVLVLIRKPIARAHNGILTSVRRWTAMVNAVARLSWMDVLLVLAGVRVNVRIFSLKIKRIVRVVDMSGILHKPALLTVSEMMVVLMGFQKMAMNWKGLLNFPRLHLGLGNVFGVSTSLARQIRPYAAAEGTPAAETRLVNAVLDGRIVQVIMAETTQTTITAFLGWPFET